METENRSIQIMKRLKNETKAYHSKLESLPYFKALMDHKLPLDNYVNQLRTLSIIHSVLEHELATCSDEKISSVWDDTLRKLPLLEKDLLFFNPRVIPQANPAIDTALAIAEKIRLKKINTPLTLLGYLYVFEGSTLGNHMHRPDISATYNLNDFNGCLYYASYHEQVQDHWRDFSDKMNRSLDDKTVHDSIIEASHEAFNDLEKLYTELFSEKVTTKSYHITQINPEAGNHPMPDDEREIKAALKASDRSWREFGYYQERYGERGKRFSDSDMCWLVTLNDLDEKAIGSQIDWLVRVLATRGMPSIMMEKTLLYLYEELARIVPDDAKKYQKILNAGLRLGKMRTAVLADEKMKILATEFEKSVNDPILQHYKNMGKIIVSSVIDEKNGIDTVVDTLKLSLSDKNTFSDKWIEAVETTIQETKKLINPKKYGDVSNDK